MRLIILGAPGAGKGTQACILSGRLGLIHISTGDILRDEIKNGTPVGLYVKPLIESGSLVPDDMIIKILKNRIAKPDCARGFILDGFPRTVPQAMALGEVCEIDAVVEIFVSDDIIAERISGRKVCPSCGATYHIKYNIPERENICDVCGTELAVRRDDSSLVIKERLTVYHDQTDPLTAYYEKRGKLLRVDGQTSVAETTRLMCEALGIDD